MKDRLRRTMGKNFVALCHFCDIHGPVFVWCTERTTSSALANEAESQGFDVDNINSEGLKSDDKNVPCMGCSPRIPNDTSAFLYSTMSSDETSDIYLSSSYPVTSQLKLKQLKELSIRCLSNEVSPSKENPVIFSDNDLTALSLTFHLKDFCARGYKRLYGIVVVSDVKNTIMANVDNLLKALNEIREKLIRAADLAFTKVAAEAQPMVSRNLAPPPAVSNTTPSNLCNVVDDPHTFERLHIQFCRVVDMLYGESSVAGSSSMTILLDEDFEAMRQLVTVLKPRSFTKLLYLILSSTGSMDRVLYDENERKFHSWPAKLLCSLCGSTSLTFESKTCLKLTTQRLEEEISKSPTKDSLFASRITQFFTADNTTTKIMKLQMSVLANQMQSLLEVLAVNSAIDTIPGLKIGDTEILRALSKRQD